MSNEEESKVSDLEGTTGSGVATEKVKEKNVKELFKTSGAAVSKELSGNGWTYRHDWGNKKGLWKLNLTSNAINCNSRVFVSATEFGGGEQCAWMGDAAYTVHNVVPYNGGVNVRVNIGWDSPIRVRLDYLIINP
ncbi:MAG TPA: hypothetical protein VN368_01620 [Candidatus Methylomirabilis sp.]|nr:hypothetical protein [Candidatus Methylomirabilis sp.]